MLRESLEREDEVALEDIPMVLFEDGTSICRSFPVDPTAVEIPARKAHD